MGGGGGGCWEGEWTECAWGEAAESWERAEEEEV